MLKIVAPIRLYPTAEMAQAVATRLTIDDQDGWTYTAIPNASGRYLVEIRDEDGAFVGYWP